MSRSPDYVVKALARKTEEKGRIGAAWNNDDGSISISLDPFTVLNSSQDLVINLFPNDIKSKVRK